MICDESKFPKRDSNWIPGPERACSRYFGNILDVCTNVLTTRTCDQFLTMRGTKYTEFRQIGKNKKLRKLRLQTVLLAVRVFEKMPGIVSFLRHMWPKKPIAVKQKVRKGFIGSRAIIG